VIALALLIAVGIDFSASMLGLALDRIAEAARERAQASRDRTGAEIEQRRRAER
jgi:hypothetical protein